MTVGLDKIALLASADLTAAEIALRGIPNDDPNGCFADTVLNKLRTGSAFLCEVIAEGVKVGFTVYEIETFGDHREFVSVATHCSKTVGMVYDLDACLRALALRNNCKSIRLHTCRHGLVKTALANGYHTAEIVLRQHLK